MEQIIIELLEQWVENEAHQQSMQQQDVQLPGQMNIGSFPEAMPDTQDK